MRRLIALACTACVALLIGTGAFAQVPPNPDNPNDTVADALAPPPYGEPINLETAKKVAAAAIAETTKRNWNAFCSRSSRLICFRGERKSNFGPSGRLLGQGRSDYPTDLGSSERRCAACAISGHGPG